MSSASDPPVGSGQTYSVTEVDGSTPASLADFVGDVHLTLARDDQHLRLTGTGALSPEGAVRFYQKDLAQHDRDIRVWSITEAGGTFVAAAYAAF